ncbi:hypothetical protein [Streptomyces sp. NBC_00842]|uniref:hypothetical protein n=1 Tax=Streptomyces sp. NBC_00842 TaxID=2975848 RepID=UPI002F909C9B|nr:hypothetical protein OH821_45035 [Streptomyces sp. NBC_00842]
MPASRAKQAETAGRRADLIRLRRSGVRFDDPLILALGYSSSGAARKDLIRALEQNRDEEAAEVSVYRQQENERYDVMLRAIWAEVEAGDLRSIETALKISDRRSKLNGWDAPVRTELSGPDGGAVPLGNGSLTELNTLISLAGETETSGDEQGSQGPARDGDG